MRINFFRVSFANKYRIINNRYYQNVLVTKTVIKIMMRASTFLTNPVMFWIQKMFEFEATES